MSQLQSRYRSAMGGAWPGWWVTWPLTRRIALGDIFLATPETIVTAGTLAGRGMDVQFRAGTPRNDIVYDAGGQVSVRFKVSGILAEGFSALAEADAGVLVEFGRDSTVFAVFNGVAEREVDDAAALAAGIVGRWWAGRWQPGEVAVTAVISARRGTLLVAEERGAAAELRMAGAAGSGPLAIADLAGGVSAARTAHVGLAWSGVSPTPFFRVVGVRRTWRKKVEAEYGPRQPGRGAAPFAAPGLLLEEAFDDPFGVLEVVAAESQPAGWSAGSGGAVDAAVP